MLHNSFGVHLANISKEVYVPVCFLQILIIFFLSILSQGSQNTIDSNAERINKTLDFGHDQLDNETTSAETPTTSTGSAPALNPATAGMSSEERVILQAKLLSLELGWAKLQWECEGRNMRLQTIHTLLTGYDKAVAPFMVRIFIFFSSFDLWYYCTITTIMGIFFGFY